MSRVLRRFRGAFARFLGVGSINTAIDVGIFTALSLLGLPVLVANTISTACGLAFSFTANRRFTFGRRGRTRPSEIAVFVLVTGVGLWVVQPLVILGFAGVLPHGPAGVLPGKLAAVAVGIVWNWCWYSRVLYRTSLAPAVAASVALVEGPMPALDAVQP